MASARGSASMYVITTAFHIPDSLPSPCIDNADFLNGVLPTDLAVVFYATAFNEIPAIRRVGRAHFFAFGGIR